MSPSFGLAGTSPSISVIGCADPYRFQARLNRAAVLAVHDLDLRVPGEQPFQIAPGRHPHATVEHAHARRRPRCALHAVEFGIPSQTSCGRSPPDVDLPVPRPPMITLSHGFRVDPEPAMGRPMCLAASTTTLSIDRERPAARWDRSQGHLGRRSAETRLRPADAKRRPSISGLVIFTHV